MQDLEEKEFNNKIDQMKNIILANFLPGQPILGSKLGSLLSPFIRPLRFPDMGGLRPFVSKKLPDILNWIGRTNGLEGDDIYELTSISGASSIQDSQAERHQKKWCDVSYLDSNIFWRIFSNPSVPGKFSISPLKNTIYLCADINCQLPENWKEINKITEEDYRRLAKEFVQSIPIEFRVEAENITNEGFFSTSWVTFLKKRPGANILREWEKKRVDLVYNRLLKTLEDAGYSDKTRYKIKSCLVKSRHTQFKDLKKSGLIQQYPRNHPNQKSITGIDDVSEIRNLMHKVINQIGINELREFRVPLGIILDILRSH